MEENSVEFKVLARDCHHCKFDRTQRSFEKDRRLAEFLFALDLLDEKIGDIRARDFSAPPVRRIDQHTIRSSVRTACEETGPDNRPVQFALADDPLLHVLVVTGLLQNTLTRESLKQQPAFGRAVTRAEPRHADQPFHARLRHGIDQNACGFGKQRDRIKNRFRTERNAKRLDDRIRIFERTAQSRPIERICFDLCRAGMNDLLAPKIKTRVTLSLCLGQERWKPNALGRALDSLLSSYPLP